MTPQLHKKTKATVEFTGTSGGKLDESAIDSEEHTLSDHYLFGEGDTKSDYSYPVVDASQNLRRGNVDSAWSVGARGGVDEDTLKSRLKKLGEEFEDNPIPDDAYGEGDATEQQFERAVEFKQTDGEQQIATGAVMVPDELDHQLDYLRADTIRDLAENYEQRFAEGDVYGGVMHSVFPEDAVELAESRVLDEDESIGDEHYPEGTWVQSYKFTDDELWSLVDDGVLAGSSIGGTAKGRMTNPIPEDVRVPDAVADGVPDDADPSELPGREITEGRILEVSAVDHPAVPRATHQEHKAAGLQKGHPALTDSVVQARLYLEGRGHDPEDAKRLAEYLQSEKSAAEGDEPAGILGRARALLGRDSGGSGGESALQSRTPDEKDGRTLSQPNVESTKAVHDAALDLLGRSDVDHGKARFTDDPTDGFDVADYGGGDSQESSDSRAGESGRDAALTKLMNDDEFEDVLKDIQTTQEELNERMDTLETDDETDEEKDTEGGDDPDRVDELAEQVDDLAEATKQTNELVERMADANGISQQADVGDPEGTREKNTGESVDDLAKLLG